MLVRPHELFAKALNMQYAIGAFNTANLETTQAIISAACELNAPVIVATSTGTLEYAGVKQISTIISSLAEAVPIPVIMHLDHGHNIATVKACIEAGYSSVMIDVSTKPIEENIKITREVVEYAHDRGVWVEAELGTMLGAEGAKALHGQRASEDLFTSPQQARRFVESTGIDALAISVGTIHGAFTGQEYIRFELLHEIEKAVPDFPLVIHGASGLAPKHLEEVATTNVCKINVDTELRIAFLTAAQAYFNQPHTAVDIRELMIPARTAVQDSVREKIKLFGSSRQAK